VATRHEVVPNEQYDRERSGAILYWLQYPYNATEPELPQIVFTRIKELGLKGPIDLLSKLPILDEISRQAAMVYCAGFPVQMIQQQVELYDALVKLFDTLRSQPEEPESSVRPVAKVPPRPVDQKALGRDRIYKNTLNNLPASIAEVGRVAYSGLADELAWQEHALCAQTDPEAFFPEKGGSTREAKKVCLSCEVRSECLEYALEKDERFGIWGGLSERERRKLKKKAI